MDPMEAIVGASYQIETKSGEVWRVVCVETCGNRAFFENDELRVQMNMNTGKMLILWDNRKKNSLDTYLCIER
jgi:hypothetical protein